MPRRLLLVLLLAALVAATCSSGDPGAESPAVSSPGVDRVSDLEPRVLRLALVEPDGLDPAGQRLSSPSAMIAMDLLLDGLTRIDARGEVVPELARSWQVSDSGLQWRFDLDTDADGVPLVSAHDVAWTIGRLAALGSQSIPGSALAPVQGYDDAGDGLAGVEAQPGRVVIRLDRPFAALPALLAHPSFGILPDGVEEAPIGAGPTSSAFVTHATADGLELAAAARFDGAVDEIHVTWAADEAAAVAAVAAGVVDLAPTIAADDAASGDDRSAPFAATVFYGLNMGHPNLAEPALRRAIVHAVDPVVLSAAFGDGAAPLPGLVPRPGRDVCGDACGHDPDVAAQLVEFAYGEADAPTVAVDYLADDDREMAMAEALAEALTVVGIPTELRPATVAELEERIAAGEHQLFRFGWVAPYHDDQAWLDTLFRSDGPDNVFNLSDDDVDALIDELAATIDPQARLALARDLERRVLTEYVAVPVLARRQSMIHREGVEGIVLRPDGTLDAERVLVD